MSLLLKFFEEDVPVPPAYLHLAPSRELRVTLLADASVGHLRLQRAGMSPPYCELLLNAEMLRALSHALAAAAERLEMP